MCNILFLVTHSSKHLKENCRGVGCRGSLADISCSIPSTSAILSSFIFIISVKIKEIKLRCSCEHCYGFLCYLIAFQWRQATENLLRCDKMTALSKNHCPILHKRASPPVFSPATVSSVVPLVGPLRIYIAV